MKPTKEQKQKRDEAICIIWREQKKRWTMKDLSFIFSLHIDTIYNILKEDRERKTITK